MARKPRLIAVVPAVLFTGFVVAAAGIVAMLNNPEAVVRAALAVPAEQHVTEFGNRSIGLGTGLEQVVSAAPGDFEAAEGVQALSLANGFVVGDRLTISRRDGRLRTLEVIEVRHLGPLINKVGDTNAGDTWAMIISRDVEHRDGEKVRFLVQDGASLPFGLKREGPRTL